MSVLNIFEGWKSLMRFDNMTDEAKQMVEQRAATCIACEFRFAPIDVCKICLCYIPAKIRSKSDKCPVGRWQ